jgi:hypothetical protein
MRSVLARFLVWVALVAYSLTAVFPGGGVVLCLEPDGHVTIESADASCVSCCADERGAGEEPGQSDERVGSCPCTDVALVAAELAFANSSSLQVLCPWPWLAQHGGFSAVSAGGAKNGPTLPPDAFRSSPVELVRRVVLRV